jgi:hypothetical protein
MYLTTANPPGPASNTPIGCCAEQTFVFEADMGIS